MKWYEFNRTMCWLDKDSATLWDMENSRILISSRLYMPPELNTDTYRNSLVRCHFYLFIFVVVVNRKEPIPGPTDVFPSIPHNHFGEFMARGELIERLVCWPFLGRTNNNPHVSSWELFSRSDSFFFSFGVSAFPVLVLWRVVYPFYTSLLLNWHKILVLFISFAKDTRTMLINFCHLLMTVLSTDRNSLGSRCDRFEIPAWLTSTYPVGYFRLIRLDFCIK